MSARATVGHLQLFQNKMIDARQMPGGNWSGGWGAGEGGGGEVAWVRRRYGHARAIDLKRGRSPYKHLSRTQTRA